MKKDFWQISLDDFFLVSWAHFHRQFEINSVTGNFELNSIWRHMAIWAALSDEWRSATYSSEAKILRTTLSFFRLTFINRAFQLLPKENLLLMGKKKFSIKFTHDSQTQVVFSHSFIYCFFSKPIRPRISDGNSNGFFLEQSLHLLTRFEMVFVFALGVRNNSNYCFISSDRNPSGGSDVVRWVDESHLNL